MEHPNLPLPGDVIVRAGQRLNLARGVRLTRAHNRQLHAPSIKARRERPVPSLLIPPWHTLAPLERSDGARRTQAISCQGLSKRGNAPTSATTVTASMKATHRIVCGSSAAGVRDQLGDLPDQLLDRCFGIGHGVEMPQAHDPMRGMLQAHCRLSSPAGDCPTRLARIDAPMAEQETVRMLPRLAEHPQNRRPRPVQIPYRFVRCIRNPYRRQFSRPVQLCQHDRDADVGLDPIARLHRSERGPDYSAVVPHLDELAVKVVTATPLRQRRRACHLTDIQPDEYAL